MRVSLHCVATYFRSSVKFVLLCASLLAPWSVCSPAAAQFENLPPDLQATLNGIAPDYQKAVGKNIPLTIAAFQALLKAAPRDGVTVTRNLAYGPDPKQILDVYQPSDHASAPVVIFIHGGAYVQGDKDF